MEAAADFRSTGVDCVCPFERPPGGDVAGAAGLVELRKRLGEQVTMNGNVHTVETLIRGAPEDVRREVREIRSAFAGSSRLIIGTGDQVGRETPEENIAAMIEESRRPTGSL
jgi:uroporphyrinogen-III decarboxylase